MRGHHRYPTPCKYVLQRLQGQFSGTQDFISLLNSINEELLFMLSGNISFHTIGPKIRREFSPLTVLTLDLLNVFLLRVDGPVAVFNWKKTLKKGGHKSFFTLYISIATEWMFLWWIVILLSFFSIFLKWGCIWIIYNP